MNENNKAVKGYGGLPLLTENLLIFLFSETMFVFSRTLLTASPLSETLPLLSTATSLVWRKNQKPIWTNSRCLYSLFLERCHYTRPRETELNPLSKGKSFSR